jgi:hypothetical protein
MPHPAQVGGWSGPDVCPITNPQLLRRASRGGHNAWRPCPHARRWGARCWGGVLGGQGDAWAPGEARARLRAPSGRDLRGHLIWCSEGAARGRLRALETW